MGRGYGRTIPRNGTLYNTIKSELDNGFGDPIQLFLRSNRSMGAVKLTNAEITDIAELIANTGAHVFIHSPYVYNFCNPELNMNELKNELDITKRIGAMGLVIHVGKACKYADYIDNMFRNIVELCNSCSSVATTDNDTVTCPILLETPAGQGTETLITPEQFGQFYKRLLTATDNIRICVDTCHVFASGYDPLQYIDQLCNGCNIDLTHIRLIHLNDSVGQCGCKTDRHAPIGTGAIGVESMESIINFIKVNGIDAVTEE